LTVDKDSVIFSCLMFLPKLMEHWSSINPQCSAVAVFSKYVFLCNVITTPLRFIHTGFRLGIERSPFYLVSCGNLTEDGGTFR